MCTNKDNKPYAGIDPCSEMPLVCELQGLNIITKLFGTLAPLTNQMDIISENLLGLTW